MRLVGAESTKIVHQFSTGEGVSGITCMGWGSNVTNKTASSRKSNASWDEVLSSDAVISEDKIPLDLPRDLSIIDIERSLPKLSLLAAGGTSYVLNSAVPSAITDAHTGTMYSAPDPL